MNRKEFEEKFCKDGFMSDYRSSYIWDWIEQYGKEQRIDELENIWIKCNCVTSLVRDIIENRIKELKDE